MTRALIDYTARTTVKATGFDPDVPVAGWYRMKMVVGGVPTGIRIWFGAPLDPLTGEELDRSHRWQCQSNGVYIDLARAWPRCADEPIPQAEYERMTKMQQWAEKHMPDAPHADPRKPIDLMTAPLPW